MTKPEPSESGKVSLGELLQLKRAERPAPEFWARFEQDLRTKQLAAIVEKRPWWVALRLPRATRALGQWQLQLPLGAAAVLALSFVVVGEYRPSSDVTSLERREGKVEIAAAPASKPAPKVPATVVAAVDSVEVIKPVPAAAPRLAQRAELARSVTPLPAIAVSAASAPAQQVAVVASTPPSTGLMRSRSISPVELIELPAVAFDAVVTTEFAQGFDTAFEVEHEGLSAPWAQISTAVGVNRSAPTSPREVRHGRILASMLVADNAADLHRSNQGYAREVLASNLRDENGYENVRRIGMGGDRLTLKF